jgi:hypothetical protein
MQFHKKGLSEMEQPFENPYDQELLLNHNRTQTFYNLGDGI